MSACAKCQRPCFGRECRYCRGEAPPPTNEVVLRRCPEAMVCSLALARAALELLREREWSLQGEERGDPWGGFAFYCRSCESPSYRPDHDEPEPQHAPSCRLARVLRELEEATR